MQQLTALTEKLRALEDRRNKIVQEIKEVKKKLLPLKIKKIIKSFKDTDGEDYDDYQLMRGFQNILSEPQDIYIAGSVRDRFLEMCKENDIPIEEKWETEDCWHSYETRSYVTRTYLGNY